MGTEGMYCTLTGFLNLHTVLQVHHDHWMLYLCSKHFLPDHMEKRGSSIRLKHSAIQTLFPAHLQPWRQPHLTHSVIAADSSNHAC